MTRWCHAPNWHTLFVSFNSPRIMQIEDNEIWQLWPYCCVIFQVQHQLVMCHSVLKVCCQTESDMTAHMTAHMTQHWHIWQNAIKTFQFFSLCTKSISQSELSWAAISTYGSHMQIHMTSHWHTFWKAGGLICLKSPMICTNHSQTQPLFGANKCELRQCAICL